MVGIIGTACRHVTCKVGIFCLSPEDVVIYSLQKLEVNIKDILEELKKILPTNGNILNISFRWWDDHIFRIASWEILRFGAVMSRIICTKILNKLTCAVERMSTLVINQTFLNRSHVNLLFK